MKQRRKRKANAAALIGSRTDASFISATSTADSFSESWLTISDE